jgi:hypothetical protein
VPGERKQAGAYKGVVYVSAGVGLGEVPPHFHEHHAVLDEEVRALTAHLSPPYDLQLLLLLNAEHPSGFEEMRGRKFRVASAVVNLHELVALTPAQQLNYLRFWLLVTLQRAAPELDLDWSDALRQVDLAAAVEAIRPARAER